MSKNETIQGISTLFDKVTTLEAENRLLTRKNESLKKAVENNYSPSYMAKFFDDKIVLANLKEKDVAYILDKHDKFIKETLNPVSDVVIAYKKDKSEATSYEEKDKIFLHYFFKYLTL